MFNRKNFTYISIKDISYFIFYILLLGSFIFSSYKAFSIPKIDKNVQILYKTSGTDKDGKVNYFAEIQDSSKKIWTETIKFGFQYDSLKIGDNIVVQSFQFSAMMFCALAFLTLLILLFAWKEFFKIITGQD